MTALFISAAMATVGVLILLGGLVFARQTQTLIGTADAEWSGADVVASLAQLGAEVVSPMWVLLPLLGGFAAALMVTERLVTTEHPEKVRGAVGAVGFAISSVTMLLYALALSGWLSGRVNGGEFLVLSVTSLAVAAIGVALGTLRARVAPEKVVVTSRTIYDKRTARFVVTSRGLGAGSSWRAVRKEMALAIGVNTAAVVVVTVAVSVLRGRVLPMGSTVGLILAAGLLVVFTWFAAVAVLMSESSRTEKVFWLCLAGLGLAAVILEAVQGGLTQVLVSLGLIAALVLAAVNRRTPFALGRSAARFAARIAMAERRSAALDYREARSKLGPAGELAASPTSVTCERTLAASPV